MDVGDPVVRVVAIVTVLEVRIVSKRSIDGHPCSEVLITFERDGVVRHALSRLFYHLDDTEHARAYHAQQFLKRAARR